MSGIPALFNIRTAIGRQAWIDQANNRIGTAAPAVHRPALERTSRGLLDRGITTLIVDSLEIDQQSERWRSQSFGLIIAETVNAGELFECDTDPKTCAPDDTARQFQPILWHN